MISEKKLHFRLSESRKEFDVVVRGKWLKRSVLEVARRSFREQVLHLHCEDGNVAEWPDRKKIDVYSRNIVAVTSVSAEYLPLFEMWYSLVPRSVEVVACCFDEESVAAVKCRTVLRRAQSRKEMWIARLDTVIEVCRNESRLVVHSDVDAFWLKELGTLSSERHLSFSIDHGLGRGTKKFALCCGFYVVRSFGEEEERFFHEWRKLTEEIGDDQLALNHLYDANKVDLLPYEKFARCNSHHPVLNSPIVWHPWLDADVPTKVAVWRAVLNDRDTWSLPRAFYAEFGHSPQPTTLGARELAYLRK